jgi:ABC-type sugar transport system permease subunit
MAHFAVFYITPVVMSFVISFTEWRIRGTPHWVGLSNYRELFHDDDFRNALKNTALFTLFYVPPMLILSLGMALLVNRKTRVSDFFKGAYFLPVVTSFVVFALIFAWIFQAGPNSLANKSVTSLGLAPQSWLQDPDMALALLAVLGILKGAGWNMVYFLAGLQAIPDVFYEAARVDGAGPATVFRRVTLPLLRPTLFFVCVLTTIGAFQVFESAYVITQGGPAGATTTIVYFIYTAGFESFRMGYASSAAYVLLLLVLVVTFIQKRYLGATADWY